MKGETPAREESVSQPMRRRLMIAAVMAAAFGAETASSWEQMPRPANAHPLLQTMLEALGQRFDAMHLTGIEAAQIEPHLERVLRESLASSASWSAAQVRRCLRQHIEADYRDGELRVVHGWWLSATEAHCLELLEQLRLG